MNTLKIMLMFVNAYIFVDCSLKLDSTPPDKWWYTALLGMGAWLAIGLFLMSIPPRRKD